MGGRLALALGLWCALGFGEPETLATRVTAHLDKMVSSELETEGFRDSLFRLVLIDKEDRADALSIVRDRAKRAKPADKDKFQLALAALGDKTSAKYLENKLLEAPGAGYEAAIRMAVPAFSYETLERLLTDPKLKFEDATLERAVHILSGLEDPRAASLLLKAAMGETKLPTPYVDTAGEALLRRSALKGESVPKAYLEKMLAPKPGEYGSEEKYRAALGYLFDAISATGPYDDEALAKKVGAILGERFRANFESGRDHSPSGLLGKAGSAFTDKSRRILEASFRQAFFGEPKGDPCEAVCELADKVGSWSTAAHYKNPEPFWDQKNDDAWAYSLASLGGLFLTKAAPYCPKARASLDRFTRIGERSVSQDLPSKKEADSDEAKKEALFEKNLRTDLTDAGVPHLEIEKLIDWRAKRANDVHPASLTAENPLVSYGNLYRYLLLKGLTGNDGLRAYRGGDEKALAEATVAVEGNLAHMEAGFASKSTGSVWHTYLLASAAVATANSGLPVADAAIAKLRGELAATRDPCVFSYLPHDAPKEGTGPKIEVKIERPLAYRAEASPRSVTAMFALYLDRGRPPKSPDLAASDRNGLMKALGCFHELGWRAALQVSAASFHDGAFGNIGSHYFYPNLPYIASAIHALKEDPALSPQQSKDLAEYEKGLLQIMLAMRKPDGTFLRMGGANGNPSSPAYVNPLTGMALLPYCAKRDKAAASGVFVAAPKGLPEAPAPRRRDHDGA